MAEKVAFINLINESLEIVYVINESLRESLLGIASQVHTDGGGEFVNKLSNELFMNKWSKWKRAGVN
jgi:hypothetical protein